jgi:hypothetical protein
LTRETPDAQRTQAFARYSLMGASRASEARSWPSRGILCANRLVPTLRSQGQVRVLRAAGACRRRALHAHPIEAAGLGARGVRAPQRLGPRVGSSTSLPRFSASTPSPAIFWPSRSSRSGCFSGSICRSLRQTCFSFCPTFFRPSPIRLPHRFRSALDSSDASTNGWPDIPRRIRPTPWHSSRADSRPIP